jgi:hypothetical protein
MNAFRTRTPISAALLRRALRARAMALGAAAIVASATVCGCASTKAPTDVNLSGQWQLDTAASDNVDTHVAQAVDRAEARYRQRVRSMTYGGGRSRAGGGDDMGQPGSEPVIASPFIGPDFRQLREHLLQILGAPPSLRLDVQEETVTIQSDHLPSRDYQPGESFVRFDEYGNATVSCGWSGSAFVVHERYMSHAAMTERYEVDAKTGTLTYTRELKDPTVGNIELKSVYHHD